MHYFRLKTSIFLSHFLGVFRPEVLKNYSMIYVHDILVLLQSQSSFFLCFPPICLFAFFITQQFFLSFSINMEWGIDQQLNMLRLFVDLQVAKLALYIVDLSNAVFIIIYFR